MATVMMCQEPLARFRSALDVPALVLQKTRFRLKALGARKACAIVASFQFGTRLASSPPSNAEIGPDGD
eukprot:scaffold2610_cov212-Pinguiococcus_pyrenoidosus.AAC.2